MRRAPRETLAFARECRLVEPERRPDRRAWFEAGAPTCAPDADPRLRPWRLALLGPPGVGKGTQAEILSGRLGPCHLSTGDLFRRSGEMQPCERTPALERAQQAMREGQLVSDDTVLALVRERGRCLHCRGGFLLDGFPRTLAQAEALDGLLREERLALDAVLSYELPLAAIAARLEQRRTCAGCRAIYHLEARPPARDGACDHCGGALVQRQDDRRETIAVRFATYSRETEPLRAYYAARGLLRPVPADGTPVEIYERTLLALR